jgi:UDP-N-acetylglucosamine 2-epimerase (non-hydrolysing)
MKLISIIGARPQFIKEAIVGAELRKAGIDEVLVNTGQHYDANMSDVFIQGLNIKTPDYNLGVGSGSHAYQTSTTMLRLEEVVLKEKPDALMVYGDTNATVAGALVGSKLKIPIAHVEAGLRQHPKDMPEEINRVVTDHISSFLFCPTEKAVDNLNKEGITKGVHFVGDVMYDLFVKMRESLDISTTLSNYSLIRGKYILATFHRDFNTDDRSRLKSILEAMNEVSKKIKVVLPLHPRTRKAISLNGYEDLIEDITILDPLPYSVMMSLLIGSRKTITDSGGLQKEAYFAGVPALVIMPDTGWIELVEAGWNVLVDANKDLIIAKAFSHQPPVNVPENLYGDGRAGEKVSYLIIDKISY